MPSKDSKDSDKTEYAGWSESSPVHLSEGMFSDVEAKLINPGPAEPRYALPLQTV